MDAKLLLLLLVGIVNAALGLLVFLKNPKHLVSQLFACLVLCVSVWTLCNYMIHAATDINSVLFWKRIIFAAASLIALSLFYFSTVFPARRSLPTGKLFWLLTGCGLIIAVIASSSLIVKGVKLAEYSTPQFRPNAEQSVVRLTAL